MPPTIPLEEAVANIIAAAPNNRLTYANLVAELQSQGYRGFGMSLMQLAWSGSFSAETIVENGIGTLYFSAPQNG